MLMRRIHRGDNISPGRLFLVLMGTFVTACLLLSGCDFPEQTPIAPSIVKEEPFCSSDAECAEEQLCRRNYCIIADAEVIHLGLTFIPPGSSAFLPQRIDPRPLDTTEEIQIGLEGSIAIRGKLSFVGAATQGPTGVLTLRRPQATDSFFTHQLPVNRGSFEAFILPGTYDLHFNPDDGSIPPKVWRNKIFVSDTLEDLALPQPRDFLTITGSITHKQPSVMGEGEDLPVPNARVIAQSSQTGMTSTVGYTDDAGNYQIQVLPNSGSYTLYVSPGDETRLFPEVVLPERFIAESHNPPPVSVSMGTFSPVGLPLHLQLGDGGVRPAGFEGELDWSDITVIFRSSVGNGILTRQTLINDRGRASVTLLPGLYDIEVIPPAHSPIARSTMSLEFSNLLDRLEFPVTYKTRLRGTVTDGSGLPLENTRLRFERAEFPGSRNEGRPASETSPIRTHSDEEGIFDLWLEPADYLITATPAATHGLPRAIRRLEEQEVNAGEALHIEIPSPALLFGTVYGDDWSPVADVTVQGFAIIDGRSRVIGEAQTNARGEFRLLLPPELP